MNYRRRAVALLLSLGFMAEVAYSAPPVAADGGQVSRESAPAILRIRVQEGESSIHTAGTRSNQPIVILVADEAGRPVESASVSVRLPDDGPTGLFANGMRTELSLTGPDGRVSVRGIQWSRVSGPVQLRVTAAKGEARAGILSTQYITEPLRAAAQRRASGSVKENSRPSPQADQPSRSKWILLTALIGGAAAGGIAAAAGGHPAATVPSMAPGAISQPPATIGAPSISVGRP